MSIEIVPATEEHGHKVAKNLREADRLEIAAWLPISPDMAVTVSIRNSIVAWAALVDGEPICVFGISPVSLVEPYAGKPWLLGTDGIDKNAAAFLRGSRPMLAEVREKFGRLCNYVDARNARAVRWLRWIGFELGPARPFGINGELFHRFEMR